MALPHLPLNALRAFEAAARLGSMSAAAGELGVTHGAVSRHVRALEAQFGLSLLGRLARLVEPTPTGAHLAVSLGDAFGLMQLGVSRLAPSPLTLSCSAASGTEASANSTASDPHGSAADGGGRGSADHGVEHGDGEGDLARLSGSCVRAQLGADQVLVAAYGGFGVVAPSVAGDWASSAAMVESHQSSPANQQVWSGSPSRRNELTARQPPPANAVAKRRPASSS